MIPSALRIVLLAAAVYCVLILVVQRWVMYPGQFTDAGPSAEVPPGVTRVWLDSSGSRVEAWVLSPSDSAVRAGVLFAHGNGELIDHWAEGMQSIAGHGFAVMLVEYPGYGRSDGRPSRKAIAEAFTAAHDTLRAGLPDSVPIVGWGRSLGGGAITDLARHRPLAALVLQSTFTSVGRLARSSGVAPFLLFDRFDNAAVVADFEGPVLVLHGRSDSVIPFAHGEALASLRPGVELAEIACGHNDCAGAWPDIADEVTAFLGRALEPDGRTP